MKNVNTKTMNKLLLTLLLQLKVLHNIDIQKVYYICDIDDNIITACYNNKKIADVRVIKDESHNTKYCVQYNMNIFNTNYFI